MNTMMNVSNDIGVILKISNLIRIINLLKTALTVGIIAFTVLKIVNICRKFD